jgi:glycosyltransferase involved in cell wall biosynthesis
MRENQVTQSPVRTADGRAESAAARGDARLRVLHLIHETAFGGVETAAEHLRRTFGAARDSSSDEPEPALEYRVGALAAARPELEVVRADVVGRGVNSPLSALRLLRELRRTRPDVLVTSLWRTVALGPLARLLSPRTRWAVWVHLPRYTHRLDAIVHRWCMPRADAVLCDSEATYETLVRADLARAGRSVPVHMVRPEAAPLPLDSPPGPPADDEPVRLVFWGRMAAQKRLDRAIDLVAQLSAQRPAGAELLIVGPDSGELQNLQAQAERLGLSERIHVEAPLDREGLAARAAASHAFVQLSDAEGFAMSAHEALAAGLVSVLTPVGDLRADTHDGVDSIHHHGDLSETARRLTALIADPSQWARMSESARSAAGGSFAADFTAACDRMVGGGPR